MGRPPKRTPETADKIFAALRAGMTRGAAYRCAGIDKSTFCRWMQNNATFATEIRAAEAKAACEMIDVIFQAAIGREVVKTTVRTGKNAYTRTEIYFKNDWRAAAWWLEKRFPEEWGNKPSVPAGIAITTPQDNGSAVTVSGSDMIEVRLLAIYNDFMVKALEDKGGDLPEDLRTRCQGNARQGRPQGEENDL